MNHHLLNSFKIQIKNMEIPSFNGDEIAAAVRAAEKR
jgi:hypothetical protein